MLEAGGKKDWLGAWADLPRKKRVTSTLGERGGGKKKGGKALKPEKKESGAGISELRYLKDALKGDRKGRSSHN